MEYLTVKDAATIMRVSERTIVRWVQDGSLTAVRIHHTIRFEKLSLLMQLDKRENQGPPGEDPGLG